MKNKFVSLTVLAAVGLLAACSAIQTDTSDRKAGVFPTATNSFLFEGNARVGNPDSPVSLPGAPTVAAVFRTPANAPSATPSPFIASTLSPDVSQTPVPAARSYPVLVYGESVNPNWEVQKRSGMNVTLDSTGQAYRGNKAITVVPRGKGDAALVFTVSSKSGEAYPRGQVTKLSFALYSAKSPLYLDQFSVSILGSNSQSYWSADDRSVKASGYGSIFPAIRLDELGFDKAIPANTWVMVEIDLNQVLTLEPQYQYVTGISLNSMAGPTHTLLIDDVRLTLSGRPPSPAELLFTPPAQ